MGALKLLENRTDFTLEDYYNFQDKIATEGLVVNGETVRQVEFYNGEIWFMAGGTINHSKICRNLMLEIGGKLKGSKCEPFGSDANFAIDSLQSIFHPDLFIACDGVETSDFDKNGISNGAIIVEVLSKSTERYDRVGKFRKYKKAPNFKEYILVNYDKPLIESFVKHEGNLWSINYFEGLDSYLHLQSVDIKVPLSAIYEGVIFEEINRF